METVPDRNAVAADPVAAAARRASRRTTRRRVAIAAAIVFVGAWAIALTYSVTAGGRSPERLNDAEASIAEKACVTAQKQMGALPAVSAHSSIAARSDRVRREDEALQTMVNTMREIHPKSDAPRTALTAWLGNWQSLIVARQNYAHDLRTLGVRARFVEPAATGIRPIADKMNDWILEQGTRTDNCNTGRLQVEVVEGPRIYGKESNS
jgi:hypothetical protein